MESEEWIEYGRYKVSSYGRIQSLRFPGQYLKPDIDKDGYEYVRLMNEDKLSKTKISIHRLVALCFLKNMENKPTVDHINRNKKDNRVQNLRWATYSEQNFNRRCKLSVTGEKYIGFRYNRFRVGMPGYDKLFETLEEAIRARDAFLNGK